MTDSLCPMCEGRGWVEEWAMACPSVRHRSEAELSWWAASEVESVHTGRGWRFVPVGADGS